MNFLQRISELSAGFHGEHRSMHESGNGSRKGLICLIKPVVGDFALQSRAARLAVPVHEFYMIRRADWLVATKTIAAKLDSSPSPAFPSGQNFDTT